MSFCAYHYLKFFILDIANLFFKDYSYVSQIILQGKWLESLGFSIGDKVIVDCQPDRIVIEKENPLLEEKTK